MKKKYRLGYDRVFLAHPAIKRENEILAGLSITIKYKLFDLYRNTKIAEEKLIKFCFKHRHLGTLQGTIVEIEN